MPKISVIVPVYNTAPYLRRCLDSVLAQTQKDFEILAVDDGSTDESPTILKEYQEKFPEWIQVLRKENGGLSDARNFGLRRATGDYIAFLDSDDFLAPDFIQSILALLEREKADLVLFDCYYEFDSGKRIPFSVLKPYSGELKKDALLAAPMAWSRVFHRRLLGEDPFLRGIYYEDLEMTPKTVLKAERIAYLPRPLYHYYQRSGSIMRQAEFSPKLLDIFTVTESVYRAFSEAGRLEEFREEIEFLFIEHLCRSAALRFSAFPNGRALLDRLCHTMEQRFPEWKHNPHLKKASLFFRLTVFFCGQRAIGMLRILNRLKGS